MIKDYGDGNDVYESQDLSASKPIPVRSNRIIKQYSSRREGKKTQMPSVNKSRLQVQTRESLKEQYYTSNQNISESQRRIQRYGRMLEKMNKIEEPSDSTPGKSSDWERSQRQFKNNSRTKVGRNGVVSLRSDTEGSVLGHKQLNLALSLPVLANQKQNSKAETEDSQREDQNNTRAASKQNFAVNSGMLGMGSTRPSELLAESSAAALTIQQPYADIASNKTIH